MAAPEPAAERIAGALSCLAADRRLGGALFVDLDPVHLPALAAWLHTALAESDAQTITLGAAHFDDDLWWRVGLSAEGLTCLPGPLVDLPGTPARTIVIPDLAQANPAVIRAAAALAGSDVGVADRQGRHAVWQPGSQWLAACSRRDLAALSPHLLDRFLLRVDARDFGRRRDAAALRAALRSEDGGAPTVPVLPLPLPLPLPAPPPSPMAPSLPVPSSVAPPVPVPSSAAPRGSRSRGRLLPVLTPEAAAAVVEAIGETAAPHRRDLVLARMARALAAQAGEETVRTAHVRTAARLLGLAAASPEPLTAAEPDAAALPSAAVSEPLAPQAPPIEHPPSPETLTHAPRRAPGKVLLTATALPYATGRLAGDHGPLHPEEDTGAVFDPGLLSRPRRPLSVRAGVRGPVIGTEPARRVGDIALSATVFEAAKYAAVRAGGRPPRIRIWPSDLRGNRRQPQPDSALVILIDHSCQTGWDAVTALLPYLRWAHLRRSAITLVEIGHDAATAELRAERHRLAGAHDARLAVALGRRRGRATPLAFGIDLAVQETRRILRQLPVRKGDCWLVVVTDGRGNIPLEASQRNRPPTADSGSGVDDAIRAAAAVADLSGVRTVVLAPPRLTRLRELPERLAEAMGGTVARMEMSG